MIDLPRMFRKGDVAEDRVLILAPTGPDARLSELVLSDAGFLCQNVAQVEELCREFNAGAGVAIIAEEALSSDEVDSLALALRAQPEWSDLPILLLTAHGVDSPLANWLLETIGNVTVLERPVRIATLVSSLRSALKARRRQYELRDRIDALRESEERLRAALERIQENERRKDEFLATLAHELRNPLAPITNALAILELCPEQVEQDHLRDMLKRQVRHMVRLIDDLLDIGRITQGKLDLRPEEIDLNDVLLQAIETTRPHFESANQTLVEQHSSEPIPVRGDPLRLSQVFGNLLNNASKYTPEGGRIELRSEVTDGVARVTIQDDGIGIPKEMLTAIFGMFVQAREPDTTFMGGLGIGLTIVNRLVEMHGGTVSAHSEGIGTGSRFVVTLPLLRTAEKAGAR